MMKSRSVQIVGFGLILVFNILDAPNMKHVWKEAAIVVPVAALTIYLSTRAAMRLKYLEGFLRICAWCNKVGHEGAWVSLTEFMHSNTHIKTTHGICPDCAAEFKKEKNHVQVS